MLAGHTHHLVAVTCALDLLEAREQARNDRRSGQARGQYDRVLENGSHDLFLDTGILSVDECVERILALMARPAASPMAIPQRD
jgi:chloramphenicol 3-O-phosphotransferase